MSVMVASPVTGPPTPTSVAADDECDISHKVVPHIAAVLRRLVPGDAVTVVGGLRPDVRSALVTAGVLSFRILTTGTTESTREPVMVPAPYNGLPNLAELGVTTPPDASSC